MTLPAARLLAGMSLVPRATPVRATHSVIVDALAWPGDGLDAVLEEVCASADPGLEVIVAGVDTTYSYADPRVSLLCLAGTATECLRAVAINAALSVATGATVRYRTGHPGLDGIRHDRAAAAWADPHLLLRDEWAADMHRRLCGDTALPDHPDPLVRAALARPGRSAQGDVLDTGFLADAESILRFQEDWVVPFVRRHFAADPALAHRSIVARPLHVLLRGAVGSAGAEIIYGNFAERFPALLTVDAIGPKATPPADPVHDLLVNYRYARQPDTALHDAFRSTGRPVLYAMDDNLTRLCELPFFAREPWIGQTRRIEAHLADADVVLTWSERCASDVRLLNPRVVALRTNLPACRLPATCSGAPADGRIVYTTLTQNVRQRTGWWRQVAEEWAGFFRKHHDRARLVLFGAGDDVLALYAEMFPGVDYEVRAPLPYRDYLDAIAGAGFHFVLAQIVEDTEFVRSKCPIKLLEATAAGAVLLASQATAYAVLSDRHDSLVVPHQPGRWTEALERSLAMTIPEREAMWSNARAVVSRDFTTESQVVAVCLAHHLARLHALLGSGLCPGGRAPVLVELPASGTGRRALLSWAWQLRLLGLRVMVRRAGSDWPAVPPALVLAASPLSGFVARARARGIACAAIWDPAGRPAAPPREDQPHMLLALDRASAGVARAAGWPRVRRVDILKFRNETPPVVHNFVCALADAAVSARKD